MKKLVLVTLFIFALTGVCLASPLNDYSKGKAALDINYRVSPDYNVDARVNDFSLNAAASNIGLPTGFDGDSNLEWGFTYGIGNNWAIQYRQATPKGNLNLIDYKKSAYQYGSNSVGDYLYYYVPSISTANVSLESKTRVEEYNVMYKLDKNFSLFTGIVKANPSAKLSARVNDSYSGEFSAQGDDKNIWQFGVVAVKPLNKDFTTYGVASFGSDYRNWEIGLGYKIAKDVELNVNYRELKVDDMKFANLTIPGQSFDLKSDSQIKGWGFGLTYNF